MLRNQLFPIFLCCWSNLAIGDAFKPSAGSCSHFWNYSSTVDYPSQDFPKKETNQKIWKDTKVNKTSSGVSIKWCLLSSKGYISLRALQTEAVCAMMHGKQQGCCKQPIDWTSGHPGWEDNKSSFNSIQKYLHIRLNLTDETARSSIL